MPGLILLALFVIILCILASCIKIVPQAHAFIVERLGGYQDTWNVGIHFKVPIIDKVARNVLLKWCIDLQLWLRAQLQSLVFVEAGR